MLLAFWQDDSGATAIEYALIAGLVSVAILGGLTHAGPALGRMFDNLGTTVSEASAS